MFREVGPKRGVVKKQTSFLEKYFSVSMSNHSRAPKTCFTLGLEYFGHICNIYIPPIWSRVFRTYMLYIYTTPPHPTPPHICNIYISPHPQTQTETDSRHPLVHLAPDRDSDQDHGKIGRLGQFCTLAMFSLLTPSLNWWVCPSDYVDFFSLVSVNSQK